MLLEKITRSLACLDKEETISLTQQAILEGELPQNIILRGLLPGLDEVANRYEKKDYLYPDIYKASFIFHEAVTKLKHQIAAMGTKPGLRGAIGVVFGDIQDAGKDIVHMTLGANGFDVEDLGKSVPTEKFLRVAKEGADFIGISIISDKGVVEAKKVVQSFKDAGVREQVKVIVGGEGVNAKIATEIIEADGYAENPEEVVEFLKLFFKDESDG